jgi:outer membrane lipoprotein SlyB
MRSSTRLFTAASAAILSAVLAACGTPDPYGANNYPLTQLGAGTPYPNGRYPSQAGAIYPYGTYPSQAGTTYPYGTYPNQQAVAYVEYGRVTNVALVSAGTGPRPSRSAAGGVIGAIVGGLIGNQIGHGGGRDAATVLGAVGGAVVGSNIGRNTTYNAAYPVYRVTVQTDQGMLRTYDVNATGDLRAGDRVRIENGVIYLA